MLKGTVSDLRDDQCTLTCDWSFWSAASSFSRDEPVNFSVTQERGDVQTELVSPPRWILDVEVCDNRKALGKQEPRLITETEAE